MSVFPLRTATKRLLVGAALVLIAPVLSGTEIYFSINAGFLPSADPWTVPDVGWAFTVPTSFSLVGIETLFSSADGRTSTLELYSGIPNQPGTNLLVQETFAPLGGSFSGANFLPITLSAGQTYFVGFKNVNGLGANYTLTADPGVVDLPLYFDVAPPPYYTIIQTGFATGRPIVQFLGVPEPATAVLVALGICLFACSRLRKLRS